jgi:copper homeostasis protein CutC
MRRVGEFYDLRGVVERTKLTLADYAKNNPDKYEEYAKANGDRLALVAGVNVTLQNLEALRAQRNFLESKVAAQTMTMEERTKALEETRRTEVDAVRWLRDARASVNKQAGKELF